MVTASFNPDSRVFVTLTPYGNSVQSFQRPTDEQGRTEFSFKHLLIEFGGPISAAYPPCFEDKIEVVISGGK